MVRPQMAGRKFYASTSTTILLSVAALILLSDCIGADDARQCYWCGPLAEQVHRSRRAPPCDAPKAHVTSCDAGLPHCAIVATAPPYVESRYCVKIYQDECYLDFCNSTKTWKMTCPCKGDLCNGQNSDREEKAFDELIAKTQKTLKKKTIRSIKEPLVKSIQTEEQKRNAMIGSDLSAIEINSLNKTPVNENESVTEIHVYDSPTLASESPLSNKNQPGEEKLTTVNVVEENTINAVTGHSEFKESIEIGTTPYVLESTAVEITDIIEKPVTGSFVKPSEELPTAEALQQSGSSDVANENEIHTTISDEPSTTAKDNEDITTEHPGSRKNEAPNMKFSFHLVITFTLILTSSLDQL